jgi:hypothetical protein
VPLSDLGLGPWVFLLLGLALAFFGRALVVVNIAVLGALLGAVDAVGLLSALLAGGLAPPGGLAVEVLQLIALLLGAIVGWVLAGLVRRVAVFVLGAIVGAAALTQAAATWPGLLPPELAWIVGAILGGVLMLALEGPLLKLGTAVLGGILVASALGSLLPPEWTAAAPLAGLAAAILGAVAQMRNVGDPAAGH